MQEKKCIKCEVTKPVDGFNRDRKRADGRQRYCRDCQKSYDSRYRDDNKEKLSQYYQDTKERKKQYAQEHKEDRRIYQKEYKRNRNANDPAFVLRSNVNRHIHHALKRAGGSKAGESVLQYLPYTIEELKEHLQNQFVEDMSWDNYGEWHIDHIYPQSKLPYDSMSHPNFLKCWALDNLQPLWASANITKGNKIIGE